MLLTEHGLTELLLYPDFHEVKVNPHDTTDTAFLLADKKVDLILRVRAKSALVAIPLLPGNEPQATSCEALWPASDPEAE